MCSFLNIFVSVLHGKRPDCTKKSFEVFRSRETRCEKEQLTLKAEFLTESSKAVFMHLFPPNIHTQVLSA